MKSRKIKGLDTSLPEISRRHTTLLGKIKYITSQDIQSFSNRDGSIIGKNKVENTVYEFTGQVFGDGICKAREYWERVKEQLALSDDCDQSFILEFEDFCGNMYWDKVYIKDPLEINLGDNYDCIINFSFSLVSDHKGYYGNKIECKVQESSICETLMCSPLIDACGNCNSLVKPYNSTTLNYTGNIDSQLEIKVIGNATNFQAMNITNGSRIYVNKSTQNLEIGDKITDNGLDISTKVTKGSGIRLSPGENELVFLDESNNPLTICISFYERYM